MLDWLKRRRTSAPHESFADTETPTVNPNDRIERLADHLEAGRKPAGKASANQVQTRVIAVCSQKGGVGKTTIAAHLAVRAAMTGEGPVLLVDADPQGSLSEWWKVRADRAMALDTIKTDDLAVEVGTIRKRGAALAIIDTPPALTASIARVMAGADLVLIPARPSPHDLRAIGATVDLVRRAGKPFLFIVNGAANRAHITAECVAALSEHGRVAPSILYQRTEWASSMINGRTVLETGPAGRSAREVTDLWEYACAQMTTLRVAA
jgi:chromosome partitioning protein